MEIWKVTKNAWIKRTFRSSYTRKPVDNFFNPSFPALCVMVLEELRKDKGQRWVVFSKEEADRIFEIGRVFINPAQNTIQFLFLHIVLLSVRESYRKGFSVTYVREDNPEKSPLDNGAPLRLALWIQE